MKTMLMKSSVETLSNVFAVSRRVICGFTLEPAEECPGNINYDENNVCPFTLESCLEFRVADTVH